MEIALILVAVSVLLALLSPVAFAVFLFTRSRNDESAAVTTEA